jgi:Lon protease-like protein
LSWAERAPTVVRLFPLRGVVLFPEAILPLHIFEPRYKQMTADALAQDRRIAMAVPLTESDEEPQSVHRVVCVGVIHNEIRLPDGRFKLILKGEGRLRITSELSMGEKLYRRALVAPIDDEVRCDGRFARRMHRAMLLGQLRRLARSTTDPAADLYRHLRDRCPDGAFADVLAYSLPSPVEFKQRMLETPNIDERLELLGEEMARLVGKPECQGGERGFSDN